MNIYLLLLDITTNKQFRKPFATEFERDAFKEYINKYSTHLQVIPEVRGFDE